MGTSDVDQQKEAANFAMIKKYRTGSIDLKGRTVSLVVQLILRKNVYPNLIILTVMATDTRIAGPDSDFAKSLQQLKGLKMVD